MATVRIRRKDLKKPDEFVHLGQRFFSWVQQHYATVLKSLAAAIILSFSLGIWTAYREANLRRANEVLGQGLAAFRSRDWEGAAKSLSRVGTEWPKTKPGQLGLLVAATLDLRNNRFSDAEQKLALAEQASALSPYLQQQLFLSRALTLEGSGKYAEAAAYAERAANTPGPYTSTSLYEAARLFLRAGNSAKASELVARLREAHSTSPEAQWAKVLLPAEPAPVEFVRP